MIPTISAAAFRSETTSYDPDEWISIEVHAPGRRIEVRTLAGWRWALSTTPDAPLAMAVLAAVEDEADHWREQLNHAEAVVV